MAESFVLRNSAGDSLPLSVIEYSGLGIAPVDQRTSHGPLQHGETLVAARLKSRIVTLKLKISGSSASDLWAQRSLYASMMNQINTTFYLDVTTDDGSTKRLNVAYYQGLELSREARFSRAPVVVEVLQLIANDPIFYDINPIVYNFGISGGGIGTPVPTTIPSTVGSSTVNSTQVITYEGTWEEYPTIRIIGPIEDCVITNTSTNEKLDFTGTSIGNDDWYEIDLRYGFKTVVDSAGNNRIASLTGDSDLATWHLAPHPEAIDGNNSIRVQGVSATGDTNVSITYYTRYIGL